MGAQLQSTPLAFARPQGVDCSIKFSKASINYLMYLEQKEGLDIRHGLKPGGEYCLKIGPTSYRLDGYYKTDNGQQYAVEYNGCLVSFFCNIS